MARSPFRGNRWVCLVDDETTRYTRDRNPSTFSTKTTKQDTYDSEAIHWEALGYLGKEAAPGPGNLFVSEKKKHLFDSEPNTPWANSPQFHLAFLVQGPPLFNMVSGPNSPGTPERNPSAP